MIMLLLIVIVPIVCMFTKLIPSNYWGFAIWMMALSVLLHRALISQYLSGTDNIIELICSRITYNNEAWRTLTNWYSGYNTVLSITILPTNWVTIFTSSYNVQKRINKLIFIKCCLLINIREVEYCSKQKTSKTIEMGSKTRTVSRLKQKTHDQRGF